MGFNSRHQLFFIPKYTKKEPVLSRFIFYPEIRLVITRVNKKYFRTDINLVMI